MNDKLSLNALIMQAKVLRRRCVEAHNRLQNDSGHSVLAEVVRCLPVRVKFDGACEEHRLLSCYAFWGNREIGGGRGGFNRRLERSSPAPIQVLHRRLGEALFGAWECRGAGEDGQMMWRAVGHRPATFPVYAVTDVDGAGVESGEGEVRVGWILEAGDERGIVFSMRLAEEAADRLRETAKERGWDAPEDAKSSGFLRVEYERDLLVQAVRSDYQTCGLDRYYFLPVNQRGSFPERFSRALIDDLVKHYRRDGAPWHITFARATTDGSLEGFRARFKRARRSAARSAGRYRGAQIDESLLPRLASDADILKAFGLGADGEVDLDAFLPVKLHPLEFLDLDEAWFDAAGVSPKTPIHEAHARLEEGGVSDEGELRRRLDEAIEAHRVRLRWVTLVERVVGEESEEAVSEEDAAGLEVPRWRLEPGYDELYEAAQEVFGETILDRHLAEVLVSDGRLAKRVESALLEAGEGEAPLQVRDLPETKYLLSLVRGIGPTSQEGIMECLREAMLGWADELARPSGDSDGQAAEGIESGLDELDELFS